MKRILILTDFSETAQNAMQFALELALEAGASCTLVHAYKIPYDFAAQIENRVVAIRKNAEEKLGKIVHQLKSGSRFKDLNIDFIVEEGAAGRVATDLAEESGAVLIVTGLSRHSKLDTFMAENTGVEIIERSRVPVLAVPQEVKYVIPREFIYAAEYREEDLQNLEELSQWAKLFDARLRVIHIEEEVGKEEKLRFRGFSKEVNGHLSYPLVSQELIKADDVEDGILGVSAQVDGVILSMAHYHKSFLKDFFGGSHTKAIAQESRVPLIVFFEKED